MTTTHIFPPAYAEPVTDTEYGAHCLWSEARAIRAAPAAELAVEIDTLREAREAINDAIAKAERHLERNGMATLWEIARVQ